MSSRRDFLRALGGVGSVGLLSGSGGWLESLALQAAETEVAPEMVRLNRHIEPLVRKIETTPREKCFAMIAAELRGGLPYRNFLAALYLAGIRNVSPQPPGFKFHCVFVINAAHELSLDAPVQDRLLPLLWALDEFKVSQAKDVSEGDFRLQPVSGKLPDASAAWEEFHTAMEEWDEERADRAIAVLARTRGAMEIQANLWPYGARDYRNIGHKSVFVANTWRTLQTIGWQHAEPALRSLVLGLLDFGKAERVNDYAVEDQCYAANVELIRRNAAKLPGTWTASQSDAKVTRGLLDALRTGDVSSACTAAMQTLLSGEATAQPIWDAVHLIAGELMMRQPGIYGIHTVTSVNGLRYAYETAADPQTRLLMLLQAVGWMGQFHNFMAGKPQGLSAEKITELRAAEIGQPGEAAEEILLLVKGKPREAADRAFALGQQSPEVALPVFRQAALHHIFRKATEPHYFKYPTAIFEDYQRVSADWRPHLLAMAAYHIPGTAMPDSPVMQRAMEAVRPL